ncbi:hypothetical protein EYC80_000681 [Monilinia laxa]|uniref:2EXR domain-containing protein n=1 Tax=Monilinia laxa TaxID=61186 RepID=A0A5N6KCL6_MONLA|nr:hypothetical protein EYC80_000681 [Monilinia laxa]
MTITTPPITQPPSPPTSPTTHFPLFALLPLELQRKIWRCTFPDSRTVSLSYNITPSETSLSSPPITLRICAESRAETLFHYTMIYRSEFPGARGKTGGNCGILLSKAMRQPICIDSSVDIVGIDASDLCGMDKGRRRFMEWMRFLDGVDGGILAKTTRVELLGLDWGTTMYMLLKYQEGLKCKEVGTEYEGQGGVEKWEELNYGFLLRLGALEEVSCRYAHPEYMGNFEEQLGRFLGLHREVWGGRVPVVRRVL